MNVKEEGEERPLDLSVKMPVAAVATAAAGKTSRTDKHRTKDVASLGVCDMSMQSSSSLGGLMMPAPFPFPAYMVPSVLVPYPFYPLHLYSPFAVPPSSIPARPTPSTVAVSAGGGRRSLSPNHGAWKRSSPLQQHPQHHQHSQHPQPQPQQQQQQSQSKEAKLAHLDPMANQHIAFKCACSRSFDTLFELSLHMQKTGHKDADQPSQVKVSKIVRGQEDWLRDQTNPSSQILKCLRCHESFVSLADLSVHMLQTQHFKTVVNEWLGREDGAVKAVLNRRANEELPPKKRKIDVSQLRDDCSNGTDSGCQSETKHSSPTVRVGETKPNSHSKKEHSQYAHAGYNNNVKEESVTNALLKMQQLVEDFTARPSFGYRQPAACSNGDTAVTTTPVTTIPARSPVATQLPKSGSKHTNAVVSNSAPKSSKTNSELSIAIAQIKSEPIDEGGKNPLFHLQEMLHKTSNMVFKDNHKPLVRADLLF